MLVPGRWFRETNERKPTRHRLMNRRFWLINARSNLRLLGSGGATDVSVGQLRCSWLDHRATIHLCEDRCDLLLPVGENFRQVPLHKQ